MNNLENNFHYDEIIKDNIEIAKSIANLPKSQQEKIKKLLLKKYIIKQNNGFFAQIRIDKINSKIYKIKEDYNEKKEKKR